MIGQRGSVKKESEWGHSIIHEEQKAKEKKKAILALGEPTTHFLAAGFLLA